jgi:magnesium transporter
VNETVITPPSSTAHEAGVVSCVAYANGRRVTDLALRDVSEALADKGRFVWIGLFEPNHAILRQVQEEFGLHDLAIEDALQAHQRPKLEQYAESLFVVLRTVQIAPDGHLEFGETHIFVGPQYVISVRHGSVKSHAELRTRCEAAPQLLGKGPGFVLYALMDFIVDQYVPVVEALEERLQALEDEIFDVRVTRQTTERIYALKRDLLSLKRTVAPLVDVCGRLMRFDFQLVPEDTKPYFRDVYDHVIRTNEMIDNVRELVTTALEANLSLASVSQQEDTRRLAAWAAIIAVPTMIAGIYGMNFEFMPELQWQYGYPVVMALTASLCIALYRGFKRSGWL